MYGGFTYNQKHSYNDLGLVAKSAARPLIPPQKAVAYSAADFDGVMTFNPMGTRAAYGNKALILQMGIAAPSGEEGGFADLQTLIAQVADWLSNPGGGYLPLIFDDMPDTKWLVRPASGGNIAFQLARAGRFELTFDCQPFNTLLFDSTGVSLDGDVVLGSPVLLDQESVSVIPSVTGAGGSYTIYTLSAAPTRPRVTLTGSGNGVTVGIGGESVSYSGSWSGTLVFDCASYCATLNGADVTNNVTGDFPEISGGPGDIPVTVTGAGLNCSAEFYHTYNVFYGVTP